MSTSLSIIGACISTFAAISGIFIGWAGRSRALRQDTVAEASQDALLRADMEYIKRGVDDVRLEQRAQGQRFDALAERVTRVEESAKQALQRLDRLDGQGG
ncbi:hypothetical protein [Cohnella massiliensis]|uniref:hypothetical protein n=2 Tax=Cohnella TaxID=329857 RepID=UPI0009B9F4D6|nr:hypothetical protein [Cohnella massiliensis]MBN2981980.1 hypothetical protein [Cohnella algarum]